MVIDNKLFASFYLGDTAHKFLTHEWTGEDCSDVHFANHLNRLIELWAKLDSRDSLCRTLRILDWMQEEVGVLVNDERLATFKSFSLDNLHLLVRAMFDWMVEGLKEKLRAARR